MKLFSAIVLEREVNELTKREGRNMATSFYSKKGAGIQSKRGFTLAELLIVVAIIAVLTAIAIPVFTAQLERSREATDLSNIRAAYAEVTADYLTAGATESKTATVSQIRQQTSGWLLEDAKLHTRVSGNEYETIIPAVVEGDSVTLTIEADGTLTISINTDNGNSGGSSNSNGNGEYVPQIVQGLPALTEDQINNAIPIPGGVYAYGSSNGQLILSIPETYTEHGTVATGKDIPIEADKIYKDINGNLFMWRSDSGDGIYGWLECEQGENRWKQ